MSEGKEEQDEPRAFLKEAAGCDEKSCDSVGMGSDFRYVEKELVGSALVVGEYVLPMTFFRATETQIAGRLTELDPSNWSKVERGVFPPPKSRRTIRDIANALILTADSDDWHTLHDLAAIGHIPSELMPPKQASERLAVFFRAARGKKSTRKEIEELLKLFK